MLINSLDEMIVDDDNQSEQQRQRHSILRGEASRINNSLIYLLGLYRIQNRQLTINLGEVFVADFLEEQIASQQLLLDVNGVEAQIDCDEDLVGFFDEQLVAGIISNILVNGAKYTSDRLSLSAEHRDGFLEITITDNGSGYPRKILDSLDHRERGLDFDSGSTNLGLFFASEIAALHECKGRRGDIALSNLDSGGGCFKLFLP